MDLQKTRTNDIYVKKKEIPNDIFLPSSLYMKIMNGIFHQQARANDKQPLSVLM